MGKWLRWTGLGLLVALGAALWRAPSAASTLPGAIQGTVTGGGNALVGEYVRLKQGGQVLDTKQTDTTGFYRFQPLAAGSYEVSVETELSGADAWADVSATVELPAGTTLTRDFSLEAPANASAIEGAVSGGGTPLSAQAVELRQGTQLLSMATTDANGSYTFQGLGAGTYRVVVRVTPPELWNDPPEQEVNLPAGTRLDVNFTATPDSGAGLGRPGTIHGHITDAVSGAGLGPFVSVQAYPYSPSGLAWGHEAGHPDNGGWYEYTEVPPGRYKVAPQGVPHFPTSTPAYQLVTITDGDVVTCDFRMNRAPSIETVEIVKPEGSPVGNLVTTTARVKWRLYGEPDRILIKARGVSGHELTLLDWTPTGSWEPYIIRSEMDEVGGWQIFTGDFSCEWDTTACWNESYTLRVQVFYDDLWPGEDVVEEATLEVQVENLTVGSLPGTLRDWAWARLVCPGRGA